MIAAPREKKDRHVPQSPPPRAQRSRRESSVPIRFLMHPLFEHPNARAAVDALDPGTLPRDWQQSADRLLTQAEQRFLFCKMNFLRYQAEQFRRDSVSSRSAKDRRRIARLLTQSDGIRNLIVAANHRLVLSICRQFATDAHSFDELVSDGSLALLRAAELFDCSRGWKFSTYATHAIRNTLLRRRKRLARRISREQQRMSAVMNVCCARDAAELLDERRPLRRERLVQECLTVLSPRERFVITARFGLNGASKPSSFREIGQQLQLSKERTRQIAHGAVAKLQEAVANRRLEFP